MTPGTYLRMRREAAGIDVTDVASGLAVLPWAIRRVGAAERDELALRVAAAEEDRLPYTRPQAELLRNVFAFDVDVYHQLLMLHFAGDDPRARVGLPVPQLCRDCACSWYDPCPGGCAWAEEDLCTACQPSGAMQMDGTSRIFAAAAHEELAA